MSRILFYFESCFFKQFSNRFVLRRDEIWFAALNDNHESEIYSLYDFRTEEGTHVSNTVSYSKQYLEGKYGADPYLNQIMQWEEK